MRYRTPKRAAEERQRAKLRTEMLSHPAARCQGVEGCRNQPEHLHEVIRRSQGGSITDPENIRTLCSTCHQLVHDNPAWAYSVGLLRKRWWSIG